MVKSRPVFARAGWGLSDQALSSFTNFALGVVVARSVGVEEFGAFSLAFALYLLVGSVCRAYPMEPLAIRYGSAPDESFRPAAAAAVGSVLLVSVVGAAGLFLLTLAVDGAAREAILALALTFPGLLVQDAWRSTFFAWRRGRSAFLNDLVWTIAMALMLGMVVTLGSSSVFWPTLTWGLAASLAALIGVPQSGIIPAPTRARGWWREHIDLGPRFIAEVLARTAGGQIATYGIGMVAGLASLGALRAAQLVLGPVQILFLGIGLIAVPEGVRALAHSHQRLWSFAVRMSAALMILSVGWGVVALLMPDAIGAAILGDAWAPARLVLVPVIVAQVAMVSGAGPGMGLKTLAAARRSLRANVVVSGVIVILGVAGGAAGGAAGAAWGLALASTVGGMVWWTTFTAALREHQGSSLSAIAPSGSPSPRQAVVESPPTSDP